MMIPLLLPVTAAVAPHSAVQNDVLPLVISRGSPDAGTYQAFPDMCRLKNGDIVAVFYAGYGHVSLPKPPDWPKGGRICLVRSRDDGHTWSVPEVIYDDADDNRDPHITELPNGTLAVTFFSLRPTGKDAPKWTGQGIQLALSQDGGKTWDKQARTLSPPEAGWYCSAPIRVLPSGTWMLGVYHGADKENRGNAYGGVMRSTDKGKTWSEPIPIGKDADVSLDAETDVIALKDETRNGTLFAALRCSKPDVSMYVATSKDDGKSWSAVTPIGFHGEAPYLYRMKNNTILLGVRRRPDTVLYQSRDEAKTWHGAYQIDKVLGAYVSLVERRDGTIIAVYYTEGPGSAIRARRFRVTESGIEALPL